MPGISLLYNTSQTSNNKFSLEYLLYEDNYFANVLYKTKNLLLVQSGYQGYPIKCIETEQYYIVIEGLIYNIDDIIIKNRLFDILQSDQDFIKDPNKIKSFINDADGEYIIYIINKANDQFYAFGDKWGRLKAYAYHDNSMSIISREHLFILNNIPKIEINKNALSEFIVFEFPLNNKTLISSVEKTPPAFLFSSKVENKNLISQMQCIYPVYFKTQKIKKKKKEVVNEYKTEFIASLEDRINKLSELNYKFTSDLSGGLDSRLIFFALSQYNVDVKYFTDKLISGDESKYALNVGKIYDKKVHIVKTKRNINISDMQKLTYITGCNINSITTLSCFQDAKERKKRTDTPVVKFSGLGGSYIRDAFKNVHGYKNILSNMIMDNIHVRGLSVNKSSDLLNFKRDDFKISISQYFDHYPENDFEDRLKHFYFDYNNNVVNMGEERARIHFWTVNPFLNDRLFSAFSRTSLKYLNFSLFINLMKEIDPKSYIPELYNYNLNLKSKLSISLYQIKSKLNIFARHHKRIRKILIKIRTLFARNNKSLYVDNSTLQGVLKIYNNSVLLKNLFNEEELNNILQNDTKKYDVKPLISTIFYINYLEQKHAEKLII